MRPDTFVVAAPPFVRAMFSLWRAYMDRLKIRRCSRFSPAPPAICALIAFILTVACPHFARADADGALGSQVVPSANLALKHALHAAGGSSAPSQASTTTQASNAYPKIPAGAEAGLPVGFSYTADLTAAY